MFSRRIELRREQFSTDAIKLLVNVTEIGVFFRNEQI